MATTLTPNHKLRLSDDLTGDARYNLNRLDNVGTEATTDSSGNLQLFSEADVLIEPNSTEKDSTGVGGSIHLGTTNHDVTTNSYGTHRILGDLLLEDTGAPGTNWLTQRYTAGGLDTTLVHILTGDTTLTYPAGTVTMADLTTVQTLDSKVLTNATIDASLNSITNITDAEVSASAAVAGTKIDPDFGSQNIRTSGELRFTSGAFYSGFVAGSLSGSTTWTLPISDGTSSQVLTTDGAGALGWATVLTDSLPEYHVRVGDSLGNSAEVDTNSVGDIIADSLAGFVIKSDIVDNANINSAAGIEYSKMEALTVSRALETSGSGEPSVSATTSVELGYLSGVTSSVQTQINSKAATADIGTTIQAWDTQLDDIAALTPTDQHVIIGDGANWQQAVLTSLTGLQSGSFTWSNADGTTKVVNHAFGNQRVQVQVWDENDTLVDPDSITQTDTNNVTLVSSQAPATSWTVTIREV